MTIKKKKPHGKRINPKDRLSARMPIQELVSHLKLKITHITNINQLTFLTNLIF